MTRAGVDDHQPAYLLALLGIVAFVAIISIIGVPRSEQSSTQENLAGQWGFSIFRSASPPTESSETEDPTPSLDFACEGTAVTLKEFERKSVTVKGYSFTLQNTGITTYWDKPSKTTRGKATFRVTSNAHEPFDIDWLYDSESRYVDKSTFHSTRLLVAAFDVSNPQLERVGVCISETATNVEISARQGEVFPIGSEQTVSWMPENICPNACTAHRLRIYCNSITDGNLWGTYSGYPTAGTVTNTIPPTCPDGNPTRTIYFQMAGGIDGNHGFGRIPAYTVSVRTG